jgi:hypothetical protein
LERAINVAKVNDRDDRAGEMKSEKTLARPRMAVAVGALAAVLIVGAAAKVEAHPFALSGFEAWAGERDVRVEFKLDAPSVLAALHRAHPERPTPTLAAIKDDQQTVFAYLGARFHISNDGAPCAQLPPTTLQLQPETAKVLLALRFACGAALHVLTIESTIFNEESPTPQILGSFHYQQALEHYFFSGGLRVANIAVRDLRQVLPAVVDKSRPFAMAEPPPGAYAGETAKSGTATARDRHGGGFVAFVWQGVLHILGGLDHVLFVISLVIAVRSRRELVLIVSSFTLAHSISLVLGTFDLVTASPRLVEPLIALSIIYVAVENLIRAVPPARPAITFGFGLVHGLGFSSALRDLGLPARQLVAPLLGFNVGVELGQLMIVLPLLALIAWLRRRDATGVVPFRRIAVATNAVVALVAGVWFVQRVLGS